MIYGIGSVVVYIYILNWLLLLNNIGTNQYLIPINK